ncbi:MAG: CNNM domain-containing protein [Gammaproteobacteria bacterium]
MFLLLVYVSIALGFSFLCSIAEAVLLSVTTPYIEVMQQQGSRAGDRLRVLKQNIDEPLAAILTLNTAAHTIGAAGAGAQAAVVFGDVYLGLASAVLTLLILIFSEIIPKTLGARYWRQLAPITAAGVSILVRLLHPFVVMARWLTSLLSPKDHIAGFSRSEFGAMAELGEREGQLDSRESRILKNLFRLKDTHVEHIMTPRSVVFCVPEDLTVGGYIESHESERFSRIPLFRGTADHLEGFVLRDDLFLAHARGNLDTPLSVYRRALRTVDERILVADAFELLLNERAHILAVTDEFGVSTGIVTLEDVLETLLGMEIVDESDKIADMRVLARQQWRRRAKAMGLDVDRTPEP